MTAMPPPSDSRVTLNTEGKIAYIRINVPNKLGALTQDLYYRLAYLMREVAKRDDVFITILTGTGPYFSAGADVSVDRSFSGHGDLRREILRNVVSNNLELASAFYAHPKILITALNGPVIGLSAALVAHSDFIYCTAHTFLLTPFTSLGLVAEGGASHAFVQRLGVSKANEALIMSKRITSEELLQTGFVNKIFDTGKDEHERFLAEVVKEVDERLGGHLNSESLVKVKALIRRPERQTLDSQNVAEVFGALERLAAGIPQEEFRKIGSGEKRHKL